MNKDDIYAGFGLFLLALTIAFAIDGKPNYAILCFLGVFWLGLKMDFDIEEASEE